MQFRQILFTLGLLALTACASNPAVVENPVATADAADKTIPVYVASHGWHTGIILPAAPFNQLFPQLHARFGAAPFYEFGWGDARFYPAKKITTALTLRAALFSQNSVVQVVAVPADPVRYFRNSEVRALCVNPAQLAGVQQFIVASLQPDAHGQLQPLQPGLYGDSQFYAGVGRFHLLHTCNTWTAGALRSAGHAISPAFTFTASGVLESLQAAQPCR